MERCQTERQSPCRPASCGRQRPARWIPQNALLQLKARLPYRIHGHGPTGRSWAAESDKCLQRVEKARSIRHRMHRAGTVSSNAIRILSGIAKRSTSACRSCSRTICRSFWPTAWWEVSCGSAWSVCRADALRKKLPFRSRSSALSFCRSWCTCCRNCTPEVCCTTT